MSDVLVVQNTRIESSGYLGELLVRDGFDITSINAKHETIPNQKFSLVVILGAPESANDDFPYLIEEQELIKNSVNDDIPVLGICLGSQLIEKHLVLKSTKDQQRRLDFTMILCSQMILNYLVGSKIPLLYFIGMVILLIYLLVQLDWHYLRII